MNRIHELLLKCAENLENGCNPLHSEFLIENNITADECFILAEQMAVAIKSFCYSSAGEKALAVVKAVCGLENFEAIEQQLKLKELADKLNSENSST